MGDGAGNRGGTWNGLKNTAAVLVTAAALTGFAVAVIVLWAKADDIGNETAWARWTFLLAGVEAIAFASAGWLFGREVNRSAVQAAEEARQAAEVQAGRAAKAEADGDALRDQIEVKAGISPGTEDLLGTGTSAELAELVEFARRRFPHTS